MALFKNISQFSTEAPLPPFIAKIYALLDLPECKESFCWSGLNNILIKNPSRLEKIILPKLFTGLTLDRFYERMQRYGFVQDKTWLQEGVMLRLRVQERQLKQTKKDPKNVVDQWRTSGAKMQSQKCQQVQPMLTSTTSKLNIDRSATKGQQPSPATVNNAGLSASEMRELQQFRNAICGKVIAIQEELRKVKERHPEQSNELLQMIKYTHNMLRIGSEVVPPRKN